MDSMKTNIYIGLYIYNKYIIEEILSVGECRRTPTQSEISSRKIDMLMDVILTNIYSIYLNPSALIKLHKKCKVPLCAMKQ